MNSTDRKLRYEIFQFLLHHCRPPTIKDLVDKTSIEPKDVAASLAKLENLHHLKLYGKDVPSPTPLAMVHPFSHLPTPYRVTSGTKSWFANCSWCAFGLAAMLSPAEVTVQVLSPTGGHITFFIAENNITSAITGGGGALQLEQCYSVFCVPLKQWWIDVHFSCSNIQMCTSRSDAEAYWSNRGFLKGEVMDLFTLWELAKAWYKDKASFEYERFTPEQIRSLFKRLGWVSSFWEVDD